MLSCHASRIDELTFQGVSVRGWGGVERQEQKLDDHTHCTLPLFHLLLETEKYKYRSEATHTHKLERTMMVFCVKAFVVTDCWKNLFPNFHNILR